MRVVEVLAILAIGVFLIGAFWGEHPRETEVGRVVVEYGQEDTGARNLVSAIYLGYRTFDTLGETIVLLLAVNGVVLLAGNKGNEKN